MFSAAGWEEVILHDGRGGDEEAGDLDLGANVSQQTNRFAATVLRSASFRDRARDRGAERCEGSLQEIFGTEAPGTD